MATKISPSLLCFPIAATEALVVVQLFPEHLPTVNPLVWAFLRLCILNLALRFIWVWQIYPKLLSPLRHLPRPSGGYPIIGYGLAQFQKPPGVKFVEWIRTVPNDGLIVFPSFLNQERLFITQPKLLGEILVTRSYDFAKPDELRDFLRRVLGDGLVVVEGDEHKFQRKHIMPVFSFRHIKNLYPMMWEKAVELTNAVAAEINDNPEPALHGEKDVVGVVEVNHWANKVTMDIIGVAGLGREFNVLKNGNDELIENYEEILDPTVEKGIYFALNLMLPSRLVDALPWKLNERVRITTSNLNRICLDLVRQKKAALAKGEEHVDILSTLVESNNFSEKELVDQLLTFLAAGHETTSSAFTWTVYLLATNPEFQAKVRAEVLKAIPRNPLGDLAALEGLSSTLDALPYLNAVCSETQRLYPTVPVILRTAIRDTQLGGLFVPKDTRILLCPAAVNRSYELWGENADQFTPERWIDEKDGELHPNNTGGATSNYSYLTFLHGPRSCIGQGFAKAELRVLVAAWVAAFEMSMADPDEVIMRTGVVTLKPLNGMKLRLKVVGRW